jgi:hypothetical protein
VSIISKVEGALVGEWLRSLTSDYQYNTTEVDWCLTPTLAVFQLYRGVVSYGY